MDVHSPSRSIVSLENRLALLLQLSRCANAAGLGTEPYVDQIDVERSLCRRHNLQALLWLHRHQLTVDPDLNVRIAQVVTVLAHQDHDVSVVYSVCGEHRSRERQHGWLSRHQL